MKCPFCGAEETAVVDTRINDDGDIVRRRRRCASCEKKFTTYERPEIRLPQVVKKNGSRVDYKREKLLDSMMLALRFRPPIGGVPALGDPAVDEDVLDGHLLAEQIAVDDDGILEAEPGLGGHLGCDGGFPGAVGGRPHESRR